MTVSSKDKHFLFWACIASLLVMAFFHAITPKPPATANAPISKADRSEARQAIRLISPVDLRQKLSTSDKPTLLVIYTSWCPYCRKIMPQLVGYHKNNQLENFQTLYISIDSESDKFIDYMAQSGYHQSFRPYLYHAPDPRSIRDITNAYHMNFNGGIPYGVVIDTDGKILAESTTGSWRDIDRVIRDSQ